ncbi:MAG: glycosyltransferase family 2 protein [Pirellulaceae bacterium]|nr:glycosyltransferase family 2 protein [Pirellulaceae bacterium]
MILLSVVIPAYNEAQRLPPYLDAIRRYGEGVFADRYEVIVVDDGSTDGLDEVLRHAAEGFARLRTIRHPKNRGKGAAVRTGALAAAGRCVLFADADGATPIEEERRLRSLIESGADLAVGSRRIAGDVVCQRHAIRRLVGAAFARLAQTALRVSVSDPQCGFKMFRREVAQELFSRSREDGYYFDLELLILAERLGYRAAEAPIQWSEQPGSRLSFSAALGGMWGAFRRLRGLRR